MTQIMTQKVMLSDKARNSLRYSWFILSAGVFASLGAILSLRQSLSWQNYVYLGAAVLVIMVAVAANLLSRRNHNNLATLIMLIGGLVGSTAATLVLAGVGIAIGIAVASVFVLISLQTLDQKYQMPSIIAGIVAGIYGFLMELVFHPTWRLTSLPPFIMIIVIGITVVGIGYSLVRQYRSLTLRLKVILAFLGISLGAIIAVAVVATLVTRQALTRSVGAQLKYNSSAFAYSVGDFLNQYIVSLRTLALDEKIEVNSYFACTSYPNDQAAIDAQLQQFDQQWIADVKADNNTDPLVVNRLNNIVSDELHEFQAEYPDQVEIFTTDCYGGLVGATNITSDYMQADEGWWQAAYNDGAGDIYISTPEYDESSKTISLLVALPIRDPDSGKIVGILRSTVLIDSLIQLAKTAVGVTGETDILFTGDPSLQLHAGLLQEVNASEVDSFRNISKTTYQQGNYAGNESLLSVSTVRSTSAMPYIDKLGWLVVTHQIVSEALAPVQTQTNLIILVAFIIVILNSIAASVVSQMLTRPITRLTETAAHISSGEFNTRADIKTGDEIEKLAAAFNQMTDQLQGTLAGLEHRIAERTRALETSALVGRRLTTILDQKQLVIEVVNQLQEAFEYYHVHIYLFDQDKENLVMVGGTGEIGRSLLARDHKLARGKGLVGRATESGTVVLVSDTTQDPNWMPNPLLPDTKSEVAVPIMLGDDVLGAIDVQQNVTGGLGQQDADLLQLISSQLAVALRNARLYSEAQRQVERETRLNTIVQHIQQTTTVDEALQVAIRDLGRALKAPRTHVRLSIKTSPDGQE